MTIKEWKNIDVERFDNEVVPLGEPAILRGLVTDWPAVQAGLASDEELCSYLNQFDNGQPITTILAPRHIQGKLSYNDTLTGYNFRYENRSLRETLDELLWLREDPRPPTISIQSLETSTRLRGFARENTISLIDASIEVRLWIGNRTVVAAHFDFADNIACLVAGRRRFTLFPPEQVANLYCGPLIHTPAGVPISLVDITDPDLSRFPRYAKAQESSIQAVLEPGDALYIPKLWWHHVEALDPINVLANYWWGEAPADVMTPYRAMVFSMLAVPDLPVRERQAWKDLFDYFVFQLEASPSGHLPAGLKDISCQLSHREKLQLKQSLMH